MVQGEGGNGSIPLGPIEPDSISANVSLLLTGTTFIILMIPGIAFFYGGLVDYYNVANTILLGLLAGAVVAVQWSLLGYPLAFEPSLPLIGNPVRYYQQRQQVDKEVTDYRGVSVEVDATFEMSYAMVAPALLSGAVALRMRLHAWLIFVFLWTTCVYDVLVHSIWSLPGILRHFGSVDFAGGLVVHASAGISALVISSALGPPKLKFSSHNIPLYYVGTALLWAGWMAFNGAAAYRAADQSARAVMATVVSGSSGWLMWMIMEAIFGRPYFDPVLQQVLNLKRHPQVEPCGAVLGMVGITAGAGWIQPWQAIIVGAATTVLVFCLKKSAIHIKFIRRILSNDPLEVFWYHGMSGIIGAFLISFFYKSGSIGHQIVCQLACIAFTIGVSVVGTGVLVVITDRIVWLLDLLKKNEDIDDGYVSDGNNVPKPKRQFFSSLIYNQETPYLDYHAHREEAYQLVAIPSSTSTSLNSRWRESMDILDE